MDEVHHSRKKLGDRTARRIGDKPGIIGVQGPTGELEMIYKMKKKRITIPGYKDIN